MSKKLDSFTKKFWTETLDDDAIIIEQECYHVGPEKSDSYFRGFGGAKFTILLMSGETVVTTNLWNNGHVPDEFYKGDNAKFIRPGEDHDGDALLEMKNAIVSVPEF